MSQTTTTSQDSQLLTPSTTENHENSLRNILFSFMCGCFAGIGNTLSSHPLDTIKVRMQLLNKSLIETIRHTVSKEGAKSLYKGVGSPLVNVPIIYAISFGSYEIGKWFQGIKPEDEVRFSQSVKAGAFAGLCISVVMTPMELIKCRLQMQDLGSRAKTFTTLGMVKHTISEYGLKGMYKGHLITITREVPAGAIYFGTFDLVHRKLKERFGENPFLPLLGGSVAGLLSYMSAYPQDVIKTRLQLDCGEVRKYPNNKFIKDGGIINCVKDVWKTNGIRGFTRGFSACGTKAMVAEATTFFIYENTKKLTTH
jgi:hypothetical protein